MDYDFALRKLLEEKESELHQLEERHRKTYGYGYALSDLTDSDSKEFELKLRTFLKLLKKI